MSGDHGRLDPAGEVVARAGVVARAAGRAWIGEDDIGMVLIGACAALVRGLGVEPDAWRELTLRYLSDPQRDLRCGNALTRVRGSSRTLKVRRAMGHPNSAFTRGDARPK